MLFSGRTSYVLWDGLLQDASAFWCEGFELPRRRLIQGSNENPSGLLSDNEILFATWPTSLRHPAYEMHLHIDCE